MKMHTLSPWTYCRSWLQARNKAPLFDCLQRYLLFVGHPRSGSSLTGSMLNAHRNSLVCNELNVLRAIRCGYRSRVQLLWLHCMRDAYFERLGRTWTGYNYRVDGAHQGDYSELRVIGDKKASSSSHELAGTSAPLHQLQEIVQTPVQIVHVLRHPLDIIGRVCIRNSMSVADSRRRFFERCQTMRRVLEEGEFPVHTLYLEEMISQPAEQLRRLAATCLLEADDDYVASCSQTLDTKPRTCREQVDWPVGAVDSILDESRDYSFLTHYVADASRDPDVISLPRSDRDEPLRHVA